MPIDSSFVAEIADLVPHNGVVHQMYRKSYLVAGKQVLERDDPSEPSPAALELSTLTGVVDYIKAGIADMDVYVQVCGPALVKVVAPVVGGMRQQFVYATAKPTLPEFQMSSYMDPEQFIILLQSAVVPSDDQARALTLCGEIKSGIARDIEDDGISQEVATKAGLTRASKTTPKNPFNLAPYRTFPEIDQPTSSFILRMKQVPGADGGLGAAAALFEADGGAWRSEAIRGIGAWLREQLGKDFAGKVLA